MNRAEENGSNEKEKNQNRENEKTIVQIKESTLKLILVSTIQGVPNIFRTNRLFFKLMWICLCSVSIVMCISYTHESLVSYLEYDTITTIREKRQPVMPFPAVTICDYFNSNFVFCKRYYEYGINCFCYFIRASNTFHS